jgi:hypothetical protein
MNFRYLLTFLIFSIFTFPVAAQSDDACPENLPPRLTSMMSAQVLAGASGKLYSEPDIRSRVLTDISDGQIVEVFSRPICAEGRVWYQVTSHMRTGYMIEGERGEYFLAPAAGTVVSETGDDGQVQVEYKGIRFVFEPAVADVVTAEEVPAQPFANLTLNDQPQPAYTRFRFGTEESTNLGHYRYLAVYPTAAWEGLADPSSYVGSEFAAFQQTLAERPTLDGVRPPSPAHWIFTPIRDGKDGWMNIEIATHSLDYLDFANGSGFRMVLLTMVDTIGQPLEMSIQYVYVGLTDDGEYLVTSLFTLQHPIITDVEAFTTKYMRGSVDPDRIQNDFAAIPSGEFTPTIDHLDALITSAYVEKP